MNELYRGKVTKFIESKGYGFISCADFEIPETCFFHKSVCETIPKEGSWVDFRYTQGKKGYRATYVEICEE